MSTKEQDVERFNEHLSSETNLVKAIGDFTTEKFRYVEVEHGLDDEGNYVWHFSPWSKTRPFPEDTKFIMEAIFTYLDKVIPGDIVVDAHPTPPNWEKAVFSIKAKKIGKKWNFDEKSMVKYLPQICDHISDKIDQLIGGRRIRR